MVGVAGSLASSSMVLSLLAVASCAAAPTHDEAAGAVGIMVGARALDEDDWEPLEEQIPLGVEADFDVGSAGLGAEMGFAYSSDDDDFGNEATFSEFYGGMRMTFGEATLRPYVGGGVTYINADATAGGIISDDNSSLGGYLHGGARANLGRHLIVGVDLRAVLGTDIELAGIGVDADYFQVAVFLGVGIPGWLIWP